MVGRRAHPPGGRPIAAPTERPRWGAFALVCFAYLGVTVGEQALSPVLPEVTAELGITEGESGTAFGLLAASIAVANLLGGAVLGRLGARALMLAGLAATVAGAVLAATTNGFGELVVAQVFLGAGAGLYFPAGLHAIPLLSGAGRRGFAMGLYGVAFSAGLTLAALLGALGAASGWRVAFWSAAALGVVAFVATCTVQLAPPSGAPVSFRFPRKAIVGLPTFIGAIGAVGQYGAIPFLTTFAVTEWGLRAGQAAALLAVGRVISILAKLASGASTDRVGAIVSARRTGMVLTATGVAWVVLPAGWPVYACAAVFAGTVSSLFPVANMVAVDHFGGHGPALGAYRSAQIGIGAAAGWLIGRLGESLGLRTTLAVAVATPVLLIAFLRPGRTAVATSSRRPTPEVVAVGRRQRRVLHRRGAQAATMGRHAETEERMSENDGDATFEAFIARRPAVGQAYVNGDAGPLAEISSGRDPATFFGPQGGYVDGASAVLATNEQGASNFDAGGESRFEILHRAASGDLGYLVGIQHAEVRMHGHDDIVPMELRITELYRREDGAWKLIHRHADSNTS